MKPTLSARRFRDFWPWIVITLTIVFAALPSISAAQVTIASEVTCRQCPILITPVVRLDARRLGRSFSIWSRVARDSAGNFLVAPNHEPSVMIFDRAGKYRRAVGKQGSGPGELRSIFRLQVFPMAGDTFVVIDPENRRQTFFTTDGRFVRTAALPSGASFLPVANGQIVSAGLFVTRDRIGLPLHVAGPNGTVRRSFGITASDTRVVANNFDWVRLVAPASGTRIWANHTNSYIFESWALDGSFHGRFERKAEWFPPRQTIDQEHNAPMDVFKGVRQAPEGIWTLLHDVRPNWRDYYRRPFDHGPVPTIGQQHRMFDTVVELIDLKRASVTARIRADLIIHGFVYNESNLLGPNPLVYSIREDEVGDTVIDVFQLVPQRG